MAIINTGAVVRTITGVNTSDLFLDESNSNITNTGAVERGVSGINDSQLFEQESTSTVTNTGVVIRDIEGINESDEMFPDNTESNITNLSEGSGNEGGGFSIDDEEDGNDILNGRLNENADGFVIDQPNWSWVDGALQYDGVGESYFGVKKTRLGAAGMSAVNQIFRFEVLEGEVYLDGNQINSNINMTQGTFGVGPHELNPMQTFNFGGTESVIYIRCNTTGTRIDNFFITPQ